MATASFARAPRAGIARLVREGRIGKAGAGHKPGSVEGNHSSATAVTGRLEQPTRESARDRRWPEALHPPCGGRRDLPYSPIWSCSGRGLPCRELLPVARCALTAPFHPYRTVARRFVFCGTFHGLAPSRRYLAPCPKEPGLSSASCGTQRLPGRLRRFRSADSNAFRAAAGLNTRTLDN